MVKKLLESIGYVCGKDFGIYHSKMKVKERNDMLERFRRKEFKILLSVRCLEEGIDVPDASIGIIIGSGRTKRQSIQRLGRIMRKSEKKFKEMWVVYCKYTIEEQIPRRLEWLLLR
jgi:superfamily II DNA or RNA helicase